MLIPFFLRLRQNGVPASPREFLTLIAAMQAGLSGQDTDTFYHLARAALVKDERHIDRFDRAFAESFAGLAEVTVEDIARAAALPEDWLRRLIERDLTPEEKAAVQAMGGLEALIAALRERLAEQQGRHQGGSKWIGTAGTSPFGAFGYNPEGIRIGQPEGREGRAVKVWDRREFRDLDDRAELGSRNLRLALRRLRAFARQGAAMELDLPGTIRTTADRGWLDVQMRPERRNAVKVLLFLDVGGSMDGHVRQVEGLFAAARSEFRHLEVFCFHNCLYERVWRDGARRQPAMPTAEALRTYGRDWRAVFVGDAAMSPYEIDAPGGSVEHWNAEPGRVWLERVRAQWPKGVWLNPLPQARWDVTPSVGTIGAIFDGRMFPLTPEGIGVAMDALR